MLTCNICSHTDVVVCVDSAGTWHCYEPSLGETFPFKVAVCQRCGHVFGSWNEDRTHLYEDQEYVTCDDDLDLYSAWVSFVLTGVPQGRRPPRILEIGFNRGALLKRFYDLGFECCGIEAGRRNTQAARCKMPAAQLDAGMFSAEWIQQFEPGFFDVVMMTSVLEHLAEPAEVLRSVQPYLAPNGRLFIVVPDLSCYTPTYQIPPDSEARYTCSQLKFFYRNLFLCYAQHINHFSGPSLTRYLAAMGFQTVQVATFGFIWVTAAPAHPVAPELVYPDIVEYHMGLMNNYERMLSDMRRAMVNRLAGRRLVCYGAGREFGYFMDVFAPLGVNVLAVADDAVVGESVHDVPCVRPQELAGYRPDVCLATSFDYENEIAAKARRILPDTASVLTLTQLISQYEITIPRWTDYRLQPPAHCSAQVATRH
ncbi:MAG: class I SAM-dependent methyltransferase [Phycisphaerae bacterium]